MTENEAIERLRSHRIFMQINDCYAKENYNKFGELAFEANAMAIKALEEIQQYRAIGTVEECRETRERQRGKKVEYIPDMTTLGMLNGICPVCGETIHIDRGCKSNNSYCINCGQKLDWSDTP